MFTSKEVIIIPVKQQNDTSSYHNYTSYNKDTTYINPDVENNTYSQERSFIIPNFTLTQSSVQIISKEQQHPIKNTYSNKFTINVYRLKIFDEYKDLKQYRTTVNKHSLSQIQSGSYSMIFNFNRNFPDFCDGGNKCNPALDKLIDSSDNDLIYIGSEVRHVIYGKYYPVIYQFDKDFIANIGSDFKIYGLSESLVFDTQTYTLKGSIPFTNTKEIKFIINQTYKFTLTLIVDVREDFVQ